MNKFIILSVLVALASAAPRSYDHQQQGDYESHSHGQQQQQQQKHIPIVKFESEQTKSAYKYGFEAANGIQVIEQGHVQNEGQKDEANVAEGYYAYKGDDGKQYTVQYIADENGFRAVGDHLPTPVPLPEENQKLIAEVYARPTSKYDEEDYEHEETHGHAQGHQQKQQQVRYQHQQTAPQQYHGHAHQQYEH